MLLSVVLCFDIAEATFPQAFMLTMQTYTGKEMYNNNVTWSLLEKIIHEAISFGSMSLGFSSLITFFFRSVGQTRSWIALN